MEERKTNNSPTSPHAITRARGLRARELRFIRAALTDEEEQKHDDGGERKRGRKK